MSAPFEVGQVVRLKLGTFAKFEGEINRRIVPGIRYGVGSVDLNDSTISLTLAADDSIAFGWAEWDAFEVVPPKTLPPMTDLDAPDAPADLDPRRIRALRIAESIVRRRGAIGGQTSASSVLTIARFLLNEETDK
jgi:hypothetical protein